MEEANGIDLVQELNSADTSRNDLTGAGHNEYVIFFYNQLINT